MRILSVSEFAEWDRQHAPSEYIFSTENNGWASADCAILTARYSGALIGSGLNRICFRDNRNSLCLERIKEVRMYDDKESIGVVFEVVCAGKRERVFRFLAD